MEGSFQWKRIGKFFLGFLTWFVSISLVNGKEMDSDAPIKRTILSEDRFVLTNYPSDLTIISDSLVAFVVAPDKLIIQNFFRGTTHQFADLSQEINLEKLAAEFFGTDTSQKSFQQDLKLFRDLKRPLINITSLQKIKDSLFATLTIRIPERRIKKGRNGAEDTLVKATRSGSFAVFLNLDAELVAPCYWLPVDDSSDNPVQTACGTFLYDNKLFLTRINFPPYKGNALECLGWKEWTPCRQPLSQIKFPQNSFQPEIPLLNRTYFTEEDQQVLASVGYRIFNVSENKILLDLKDYDSLAYSIISFKKMKTKGKWLVQYLKNDFFNSPERMHHLCLIDTEERQKNSCSVTVPVPFVEITDSEFLRVSKDSEHYYYELFKMQ